ncbi:MAG: ParB/RepB/Spo0J family partition protein [Pseudomonadota bacterium]
MATKKRGLGKGLDALMGTNPLEQIDSIESMMELDKNSATAASNQVLSASTATRRPPGTLDPESRQEARKVFEILHLPVEFLQRGMYQPRQEIREEALQELAQSIKQHGIMQPLVVRPTAEQNHYEIIAGERRWRAAQLAGLHSVPCVVRQVADQVALALSLIENVQREDLTPLEEAISLERLQTEFSFTHQQIAETVGRSRTAVTNLLRLLGLNEDVKKMMSQRVLEMGHARALLPLPSRAQVEIAQQVIDRGLSVRQTESLVKRVLAGTDIRQPTEAKRDADILELQNRLSDRVGAPVLIQHRNSGQGRLIIRYHSLDELDGILSHIR